MRPILVVGAGFAGAVHARLLAESGWQVTVIDRRPHVAGNAYDEVTESGVRIHRYGPHLFHTNNTRVVQWLSGFGEFIPYEHRVQAELPDGRHVPMPINRTTINEVFGVRLTGEAEVRAFLATQAEPAEHPRSAADHLNAQIGRRLTDLFFRPYTRKMWALDLEDLDAAVVQRVPLRFDDENRYFPDDVHQILPRSGYTALISNILDHAGIRVELGVDFEKSMVRGFQHCFNSMAIDEYFDGSLGPLPYRSIRFHHESVSGSYARGTAATVNFTDTGPLTRETDWSRLPAHVERSRLSRIVTREEPCDDRDNNMERYYPVKTTDGRYDRVYQAYKALAEKECATMTFIGRCGTYQYLDMHQVINQSMSGATSWMRQNH